MKIMIVDDHSGIRQMLRSLLANPGIELSECTDGSQALEVYDEFKPDWVFMDSVMKGLDGLSATRRLKNIFPDARVLIVSEDDVEQLRRAARAAGARGFVTKDELLAALTQHQGAPLDQLELLWSAAL
jgi:two-component system, chemotaxis family, chemotaxis protein CheY